MINGVIHGEHPVVYEAPKPKKIIPTEEDLYIFDKFGMGSIIGQITNKGASMYAMLPILKAKYGEDSKEYLLTLSRLKQSCKAQSCQIDKTKLGREVKGIPKCWMVKSKEEDDEFKDFIEDDINSVTYEENNHILLNRRPYFFKYLYRDSKKEYKEYQAKQEILSIKLFGKPLDTILHSLNRTDEEQNFVDQYYEWCPLIISNSCMNMVCKYIESIDFDIKSKIKSKEKFEEYRLYRNNGVIYSAKQKELALRGLSEYKQLKAKSQINKSLGNTYLDNKDITTVEGIDLEEICFKYVSNINVLTNIFVDYFYGECPKSNKDILWKFFGKYMFNNILENTETPIMFPLKDKDGDINYLGETYSLKEIRILE